MFIATRAPGLMLSHSHQMSSPFIVLTYKATVFTLSTAFFGVSPVQLSATISLEVVMIYVKKAVTSRGQISLSF